MTCISWAVCSVTSVKKLLGRVASLFLIWKKGLFSISHCPKFYFRPEFTKRMYQRNFSASQNIFSNCDTNCGTRCESKACHMRSLLLWWFELWYIQLSVFKMGAISPKIDRKWAQSGPEVDRKSPKPDRNWTGIRPKSFFDLIFMMHVFLMHISEINRKFGDFQTRNDHKSCLRGRISKIFFYLKSS